MHIHLQPKQGQLYDLLAATGPNVATIIGGGGAKGGGKSDGARGCALLLAVELGKLYPGLVITIVRRTYGDLKKNHIDPFLRKYPELMKFYKADAEEINFGESKIVFMYAENDKDVKRKFLGGYESAIIIIDEAQQFSEEELQWITTAARWTDSSGGGIPAGLCKTLMLFNPGGPGSTYIRRVFWLKLYVGEEKPHKYAFIHIFGFDNYEWFRGQVELGQADFYRIRGKCSDVNEECVPRSNCCRFQIFIIQTEEGQKYNAYPASMRSGYLLGSFESFAGQYFSGVWYEKKHVLSSALVDDLVQYWWNCLAAGTLVRTARGEIPIEQVMAGDWVWTRKGLRRVARSWLSRNAAPTIRARFSNGQSLVATEGHRICINDGVYIRLDCVSFGDRIVTWSPSTSTEKCTPSRNSGTTDQFPHPCIETSGSTQTGQSLKGFTSIIRMAIVATTISRIWSACQRGTISASRIKGFLRAHSIRLKCWPVQSGGGLLPKAKNISNALLQCLRLQRHSMKSNAGDVESKLGEDQSHYSVQPPAISGGDDAKDSMTWNRFVRHVEPNTWRINTMKSRHAPRSADSDTVWLSSVSYEGECDVYDLAIEGEHEFYANDILVHNCWLSTDWGYGEKHWCFTYWAATGKISPNIAKHMLQVFVDKPIDIIVIYRELMVHRMEEADFAHRVVEVTPEAERKALTRWVAGSDTKQLPRHMRHSPREIINGICTPYEFPAIQSAHDEPGSRSVNAGLMRGMLHRTARMRFAEQALPTDEQEERLPLVFVSAECPLLISSIPVLLDDAENGKPEDVQKMEQIADDAFDACKYLLAEYASVKDQAPRSVRLYDTMMQAKDQTVKLSAEGQPAAANHNAYMAMLKFDQQEQQQTRRGRRA